MKFLSGISVVLLAILIHMLAYIPGALIACWLWSAIIIPVFSAPTLTFWQMYGILWLFRCINIGNININNKD